MMTCFRTNLVHTIPDLRNRLHDLIARLPQSVSSVGEPLKILRYEFVCESISLLAWLHNQDVSTKIYFSNREQNFETAGIGICAEMRLYPEVSLKEAVEAMEDQLSSDNPYLRFYGGICFDPRNTGTEWESYGAGRFFVPRFEFSRVDNETIFALNIALRDINEEMIAAITREFDSIDFSNETTYRAVPKIVSRLDTPDQSAWSRAVKNIQQTPGIEKTVLARRSEFTFNVDIRPSALIKHLKNLTPGCYHFCVQLDRNLGFLGASPERLYKRSGEEFLSEALAGTAPRGGSPEEDIRLSQKLISSAKNIREHAYVVHALDQACQELCSEHQYEPTPQALKLKEAFHLITRFSGTLNSSISDTKIIETIHPTPAVAGHPTEEALSLIAANEKFSRGWYSGAVGYIGYDTSEFVVAIRSGLVNGHKLSLYAGAGIIRESDPQEEWAEVENKISRFMKVFNP